MLTMTYKALLAADVTQATLLRRTVNSYKK